MQLAQRYYSVGKYFRHKLIKSFDKQGTFNGRDIIKFICKHLKELDFQLLSGHSGTNSDEVYRCFT